ncbi:MAG: endolytic transglycosylase MltG [Pseudomonadota bacterium]
MLLLLSSLVGGWLWRDVAAFLETPLAVPAEGVVFDVEAGVSIQGIAERLAQQGLIQQSYYLIGLARFSGLARRIKAGEYRVKPGTNPRAFLELLASGKVVQYALTLVEGWNIWQVLAAVAAHPKLAHTLATRSANDLMTDLGAPCEHPEGRFLPDTYHFPNGTTDVAFLRRAYLGMEAYLPQSWAQRAARLPLASSYEALILASIVERETALPGERPQVAGVFLRRLRLGMRLQSDPTVTYGITPPPGRPISHQDLARESPYNTYLNEGLPPTPIANPSRSALQAVLHPAEGSTLYFVAKGDGSHYFSETLAEHNRAIRRYFPERH